MFLVNSPIYHLIQHPIRKVSRRPHVFVAHFTTFGASLGTSGLAIMCIYIYIYLVGDIPTPLKNMSSSVGMTTFPIYGKS